MQPRKPSTIAAYLARIPEERRRELERVRGVIVKNLPKGYEEAFRASTPERATG